MRLPIPIRAWPLPFVVALGLAACRERPAAVHREPGPTLTVSASASMAAVPAPPPPGQPSCDERIAKVMDEPALPGTPALDARRVELFVAVRGRPVLFVRPPSAAPSDDVVIVSYRRWFERSRHPGGVVASMLARFQSRPAIIRGVLLRDGYLYAEDLPTGSALVRYLRADLLFDDPEIWIQRGEHVFLAVRDVASGRYLHADGPDRRRPVALALFDRIGVGPVPEPVHRDVADLRERLGFRMAGVRRMTSAHMILELQYGDERVPTLLESHGAHLDVACESLPAEFFRRGGEDRRALERLRNRAFASVRRAIAVAIEDRLPFDEPRHERGQEDGKLRPNWRRAYDDGKLAYRYHSDEYAVFGPGGQPLVPEVCVDFLLDTLERASGTWWRPNGEPRERVVGRIDFDSMIREGRRRAPEFVEFVRAHPEWFDLLEIPEDEQVPMGHEVDFIRYLQDHVADFIPGDMLLIGGHVPWDLRRYVHYHSFFVFDSDPVTGIPLLVAGNPGTPSLRPWRVEMSRTPRRTLRFRIRPRPEWLASIVLSEQGEPAAEPFTRAP